MQKRKTVTLSAVLYTMIKRWKVMLVVFIIVLAAGVGIVVLTNGKKGTGSKSSTATTDTANTVLFDERSKKDLEGYEAYIKNSAYMNLDPNDLHSHQVFYSIVWKEQGLDPAALEKKYADLYSYISAYFPSDDFAGEIIARNKDYKGKELQEIVFPGRNANNLYFNIMYTDNYYIKDICEVIDSSLKQKTPEWFTIGGEFELIHGPEKDIKWDGVTNGFKSTQDSKRNALNNLKLVAANAGTTSEKSKGEQDMPIAVKLILAACVALAMAILAGIITAIYSRRINTSADVYDMSGEEVICVLKGETLSRLDKLFYRWDDRFHDPGLYLSIIDKSLTGSGVSKLYFYNCSDSDMSKVYSFVRDEIKNIETEEVAEDNKKRIFLTSGEDEAVLIFVKRGLTVKRMLAGLLENLNEAGVKCAGIVFAV